MGRENGSLMHGARFLNDLLRIDMCAGSVNEQDGRSLFGFGFDVFMITRPLRHALSTLSSAEERAPRAGSFFGFLWRSSVVVDFLGGKSTLTGFWSPVSISRC